MRRTLLVVLALLAWLMLVPQASVQAAAGWCSTMKVHKQEGWTYVWPSGPNELTLGAVLDYNFCPTRDPANNKIKLKKITYCWTWTAGGNPAVFQGVDFNAIFLNNVQKYIDPNSVAVDDNEHLQNCSSASLTDPAQPGNMMGKWWKMSTIPSWGVHAKIRVRFAPDKEVDFVYVNNAIRVVNPSFDPSIP